MWYAFMAYLDTLTDQQFFGGLFYIVLGVLAAICVVNMVKTKDWPTKWFAAEDRPRFGDKDLGSVKIRPEWRSDNNQSRR